MSPLEVTVVASAALAALAIAGYSIRLGITPTPTSASARRVLFDVLPDRVDGTVAELGCGWGGLAIALARRYPNHSVLAVELSPVPWLVSRLRFALAGLDNLELRRADFQTLSLQDCGLVVCYLFRGGMERLTPKLERELPAGAWVVSNSFAAPGWHSDCERAVSDLHAGRIYRYRVGA